VIGKGKFGRLLLVIVVVFGVKEKRDEMGCY
jgi:hypothetical protein